MSYVDAWHDRDTDRIHVVERLADGTRRFQEYAANYLFYYPSPKGKFRGPQGESLDRFSTRRRSEFERERRIHSGKQLYESDIHPVFRCLSENYLGQDAPRLHTMFIDIETDFNHERGFAPPQDPFNPVTAITVYLDWTGQLITLVRAPASMSRETAVEIVDKFENTMLFDSEVDMFEAFFQIMQDCDVITGWNSEGFDLPYLINRTMLIMSKDDTRNFCMWDQYPVAKTYERFGKEEQKYELIGRVHLDYLQLYKKYNYESRHSYKLDFIGEMEVGESKVQYEGSLDQLYNRDFAKFIEYNRQDTLLVYKIHSKLQFLELANQLAHENTVLLPTVMGSVAMIEQAVINEAHHRNIVIPDKVKGANRDEQDQAAGAFVANPKAGIHQWIGAVDINSLYPSVIRALNLAPETIVGQLRPTITDRYMAERAAKLALGKRGAASEDDVVEGLLWDGLFGSFEYEAVMRQERGTMIIIDWEAGGSDELSAAEIWQLIFDSNRRWILTANGTIFSVEQEGVIPGLLTKWYSDRKSMQKKLKESTEQADREYWDKRQLVRKILLNSAYGALLNEHCRFYDKRIGQSVTLCGRQIVRHMMSYINESVTGQYTHEGETIIYGDTDSCYFSAYPVLKSQIDDGNLDWTKESVIELYDGIAAMVNDSFPQFMERAFHAPRQNGVIIRAGREIVADRGLFLRKKRYAVNIYDKEGKRKDQDGRTGEVKVLGMEIKRSDTPKFIQEFLMQVLKMVLTGADEGSVIKFIADFRSDLNTDEPWTLGSPKSANKITYYHELEMNSTKGRANMPGHVRASINWNYLRTANSDNYSMRIHDGMKVVVCKLKPNLLNFTSIAYPTDELRLPKWFTELPFNTDEMVKTLVDDKIENLLGVLNWDLKSHLKENLDDLFVFE